MGQAVTVVDRTLSRESCHISLRKSFEITANHSVISAMSWVFPDEASGERWVTPAGDSDNRIEIFDAAGQHVRSISEIGENVIGSVSRVVFGPDGDGIAVDRERGLIHWLASAKHDSPLPSIALRAEVSDAILLRDRTVILGADFRTTELTGIPLHVVDPEGNVLRSFGAEPDASVEPGQRLRRRRLLFPSSETTFWVAAHNEYAVHLWSTEGRLLRSIQSEASWFVPWVDDPRADPLRERPLSVLKSMQVDEQERLWLMFQIPDTQWQAQKDDERPGNEHTHDHGSGGKMSLARLDEIYDTVVEVVDLKTGRLLASHRMDELFGPFVGSRRIARMRDSSPGKRLIEEWTLELHT